MAKVISQNEKSARLSCRIRPVVKERAESAARLLGQSITDFAEEALKEKSAAVFAESDRIILSARAFDKFMEVISGGPNEPSEELLRAIEVYKRHEPVLVAK